MPSTPGTINYPAAMDDADSLIRYNNNVSSTLTAGINNSVLLIPVSSPSSFSSSGIVTITDSLTAPTKTEIVIYTSKSGSDLVVPSGGRGAFGSTAQSFSNGHFVEQRAVARSFTVLADAVLALETKLGVSADTPALGQSLFCDAAGSSLWLGGATRRIHINLTQVGNVGSGTDELMSFTVPGGTLAADNDSLFILATGKNAATASNRTLAPVYAGVSLDSRTVNFNATGFWSAAVTIFRTGATSVLYRCRTAIWNGGVATPAIDFELESTISGGGFSNANDNIFKMTGNSVAANDNDLTQSSMQIFKTGA